MAAYENLNIRVRPEIRAGINDVLAKRRGRGEQISLNKLLAEWLEKDVQEALLAEEV